VSRSYSSLPIGALNRAYELTELWRKARQPPDDTVAFVSFVHGNTSRRVFERFGVRLEGLKILDVGPGQHLGCLRCFSVKNDVRAIDTDVIAQGCSPVELVRMLLLNNPLRSAKTLARKALGVDAYFERELARQLGVPRFRRLPVDRMSATRMTFEDEVFDFVYSHSVFEHIDKPELAVREVVRVLKPGGIAYISVHSYTSHSGQHDPKILSSPGPTEPYWPHLRHEHEHTVHPNAYLNRLSLAQWRQLFTENMPGVTFEDDVHLELAGPLEQLRAKGELRGFTDEELLTLNVVAMWQKPPAI
jgi:SAM-dependent methyltransferase